MREPRPTRPSKHNRQNAAREWARAKRRQSPWRRAERLPRRLGQIEESEPSLDFRGFVSEVNRLLGKYVPEAFPQNGADADPLDEETVAYFQVEGIIDPAFQSRWDEEEFGYRHILQALLAIKLQAQGLGVERIRRRIAGRENAEYEEWLIHGLGEKMTAPARSAWTRSAAEESDEGSSAREPGMAKHREGRELIPANAPWTRLSIAPGFEIHLSGDLKAPENPGEFKEIMSRVRQALTRHFEATRQRRRDSR